MPNFLSVGDMSQSYQMNRLNADLKSRMNQLSLELTTGKVQDVADRVGGDYSPLTSIERSLKTLEAYQHANASAALTTTTMQNALETVQTYVSDAAPDLLMASDSGHIHMISPATGDAKQKFGAVISAINTQVAGRSLFSGTATDQVSLANPETILNALNLAIAAETTAAGVQGVIDTWFAPGGDFETVAYQGSTTNLAPLSIGPHESATLTARADDTAIRETLKGLATAALVHDGALASNLTEQTALVSYSASTLISAESSILTMRTNIGTAEAQIEQASVRNATESQVLEIARAGIVEADPYQSATELEAAQIQLETLYTLTSRLSRLSLANYL